MPIAGVCPNAVSEYQAFVDDVNNALQRVGSTESSSLFGEFNAHIGTDSETLKGVIGRHGDPAFKEDGRYLLQLCCSNGLCIMNAFFQHRDVHKYTWYRPSMAQKSLLDDCCVSFDLFSEVLDVRVKRRGELSTNHHLVFCPLRFSKPLLNRAFFSFDKSIFSLDRNIPFRMHSLNNFDSKDEIYSANILKI